MELTSKATLEGWSSRLEIVVVPEAMQEQVAEGENVLEVSGEKIPSMELADQIAVHRWIPVMDSELSMDNTDSDPVQASAHHLQWEVDDSGSEAGDIVQDAQFFQDAETEYQLAYQSLDEKYTHQAVLGKEASEALKASKSHVSVLQEELMALKRNCEADIQQAVGQAVSQYEHQLQSAQSLTREHQTEIAVAGTSSSAPSNFGQPEGSAFSGCIPRGGRPEGRSFQLCPGYGQYQ